METKDIWVIVRECNDYNQYGAYFVTAFTRKPNKEELDKLGYDGEHLLKGGGRVEYEFDWYYLVQIKEGELYHEGL